MMLFLAVVAFLIILFAIIRLKLPLGDIIFLILMPPFFIFLFLLIFFSGDLYASIMLTAYASSFMLPALVFFSLSITFIYKKYSFSYIKLILVAPIIAFASVFCYIAARQLIHAVKIDFDKLSFTITISIITGTISTAILYYIKRRRDAN